MMASRSSGHQRRLPVKTVARTAGSTLLFIIAATLRARRCFGSLRHRDQTRIGVVGTALQKELFDWEGKAGKNILAAQHILDRQGVLHAAAPHPNFPRR
jgi:hypothetical protein